MKTLKRGRTEREILSQMLDALRLFGIDAQRQNTGAGVNPSGKTIRFGTPGNSDISGMLPDGRKLDIEVKREGWRPWKTRGAERERWLTQRARLDKTNTAGGVGLWTDCPEKLVELVLPELLNGAWIEINERGVCYITDERNVI